MYAMGEGATGNVFLAIRDEHLVEGHREEDMEHMGDVREQFRYVFLDKNFPVAVREEKAREFDLLVQTEEMTVARFSMMSRYAPELVDTPENRAMKCERGLLPRIQTPLTTLMLNDY